MTETPRIEIPRGRLPPPLYAGLAASLGLGALAALPLARTGRMPWTAALAAEGAELAPRLAAADPAALARAAGAEAGARFDAFLAGVERYRVHPRRPPAAEWPALWRRGTTTLREHYPSREQSRAVRPVLLVPSLVNRARILDLAPRRSFTRLLAARGLRPLVVDWGAPGPEESAFSLGDYMLRRLEPVLDAACALAGGPVPVVGYCMGGLLALALAQRRADAVSALALLAAPWDFHAADGGAAALALWAEPWFPTALDASGALPAAPLQGLFALARPRTIAARYRAFAALTPGDPAADAFVAIEDWLNDGVPLAGAVAREGLFDWYGRNGTARGRWSVAGTVVDPAAVAQPALAFVPARDRVVPPESAAALVAALPAARILHPRAGHIGMVAGRRAARECAGPLAEWLLALAEPPRNSTGAARGAGVSKGRANPIDAIAREGTMTGRVALVTGGTRGIGAAVARALADEGYRVAAVYAGNDERASAFNAETGIPVRKWDVSDFAACEAGAAAVAAELGPVEVLVNNAGITRDGTMHRMTRDMWQAVIDTNIGSCFNMARCVIDGMRERGFGRIVNIGSINGQAGQYGQVNYAAAKSGIHGFTKALAQEGAAKGITVNAIAPGYIDTDMVAAVPERVLKRIVDRIPVGRLGRADEIARAVVFLVADEAGFITGSTLSINGGQHMY